MVKTTRVHESCSLNHAQIGIQGRFDSNFFRPASPFLNHMQTPSPSPGLTHDMHNSKCKIFISL